MRLLLDTCALIWIFVGSDRIGPRLREELTDPAHELYFSDTSLLEIIIKHQLGKLPLPKPPSALVRGLARKHAIDPWAHDWATLEQLESLPLLHRDPFDRLLVAQARAHGLTLVTPDAKIHAYDVRWRWIEG